MLCLQLYRAQVDLTIMIDRWGGGGGRRSSRSTGRGRVDVTAEVLEGWGGGESR